MPAPGAQYESDNIKNPFEERRVNEFTAREIATLQSRLNKQLGPEYISHRAGAGGSKVAYLEGTKAIALANDVFGFNGWSSSLQQVQVDYVDEHQNGRINLGLSIIVRVTLKDGTYHEDIGYGMIENAKGKGAAFEKAKKEAATDGLKRALRSFGNVLGNCLYDKEYLKKVNTIKVKPIAFDEEKLHRHPSYRPAIKKEEHQMVKHEQQTPMRPPGAATAASRNPSDAGSSVLSIAAEFDDEFGGNLFDGVEISEHQGDEFTFEAVSVPKVAPKALETQPCIERNGNNGGNAPQRQPVNRVHSMPAMRNGGPPPPQQQHQGPARPAPPPPNARAQQAPNAQTNNARPEVQRRAAPTADAPGAQKPVGQQAQNNQPLRTTPPQAPGYQGYNQNQPAPSKPNNQPVTNLQQTNRPPTGFVSGRAATLVQNTESTVPLDSVPGFNPQVESPLPRHQRTPGVDHNRSMKITREAVGVPTPPLPQQQEQQPHSTPGGGNQFRPVNPANRTNFVNPQHDSNRRIGMPGAHGMSPLANRGAYKPPGPVGGIKRPPLADVSNQNANANGDGPPDAKKPKIEPGNVGSENTTATTTVGT